MSEPRPVGQEISAQHRAVRGAVARAADATGVDFGYLLGQARLESNLNPGARAATSSAAGLYQFTKATWLDTLDRHGAEHGLGWAAETIDNGVVRDPAMRSQILAMRFDPDAAALMAGELAADNGATLTGVLGRTPDAAELYLAHFLGVDGATRFLTGLSVDPAQPANAMFPAAAEANRGIFYSGEGAPRSLSDVMGLIRGKMTRAMGDLGIGQQAQFSTASASFDVRKSSPMARAEHSAVPQRASMADVLADMLGGQTSSAPANIRKAYGTLKAFGL